MSSEEVGASARRRKRFIQIGVGGFGRRWVEALQATPRAECVAIMDINPDALGEAGKALELSADRQFTDLESAMAVDFDAAVVCTPPAVRMPIYRKLAAAGKHVLCEKPLAETIVDAVAARDLAAEAGIHFVVSQNYRYHDHIQTLKAALDSGLHGRPRVAHVDFFKFPRFFGFREEMPYPLTIDMSIHHFDLARFLLSADPLRVVGASWNPPWSVMAGDPVAALAFEMTRGVRFVYNGSWTTLRPPEFQTSWSGSWYIECEHGFVCMIDDKVHTAHWSLDEKGRPEWEPTDSVQIRPQIPHGQAHMLEQFIYQMDGRSIASTSVADNVKSSPRFVPSRKTPPSTSERCSDSHASNEQVAAQPHRRQAPAQLAEASQTGLDHAWAPDEHVTRT